MATLTTAAIVDYALSHGFSSVGWHCEEYNLPSMKTAEKAGFKLERKYIQYYACANEAFHLEETAQFYFRAKRYKEAVESYFQDFLRFFFPHIANDIDFDKGYEFLDKELKRILREAGTGKRYADILVKVYLKDGQEEWLLIHIEVQGYGDKE